MVKRGAIGQHASQEARGTERCVIIAWNPNLLHLAFAAPGPLEQLIALHSRGAEYLLLFALVIISSWGPAMLVVGFISLLGTRKFLSKAALAKGHVSEIYDVVPEGERHDLFSSRIVTVQFWTEQEEVVEFQNLTFQANPESATGSLPVHYNPSHPSEAKISSFEGLWLASGLVIVSGIGFSILSTALFLSIFS